MRYYSRNSLGFAFLLTALAVLGVWPLYAQPAAPPASKNGAALTPQQILEKMDQKINGFADQFMASRMTVVDASGAKKSYDFTNEQKGEKRLVRFTSGELKGMATLIQDKNRIYVYLPGYKKVRRLAPHSMNQTFAGSDFTNNDMANVNYSKSYDAKMEKEDAESWTIRGIPKPGENQDYASITVKVRKKDFNQQGIEYFNAAGKKVKTMECEDYFKFPSGIELNRHDTMTDVITGHKTIIDVLDYKVNQGLKDSVFTERQLEWGN